MKKFLTWVLVILAIAAIIAVTQMAEPTEPTRPEEVENVGENNQDDLEQYVGAYEDEYSQRASADIKLNDDRESLNIKVHWSDSAWSGVIWEMNAILEDDKLVYEDGVKDYYQFTDETSPETYTRMDENQKGYFEIKDEKLYWLGSPEDDCKQCIFSIPNYPEAE